MNKELLEKARRCQRMSVKVLNELAKIRDAEKDKEYCQLLETALDSARTLQGNCAWILLAHSLKKGKLAKKGRKK